jgi:hypothetical protein
MEENVQRVGGKNGEDDVKLNYEIGVGKLLREASCVFVIYFIKNGVDRQEKEDPTRSIRKSDIFGRGVKTG